MLVNNTHEAFFLSWRHMRKKPTEKEQSLVVARISLSMTTEQVALSCAGVSREGGMGARKGGREGERLVR